MITISFQKELSKRTAGNTIPYGCGIISLTIYPESVSSLYNAKPDKREMKRQKQLAVLSSENERIL